MIVMDDSLLFMQGIIIALCNDKYLRHIKEHP